MVATVLSDNCLLGISLDRQPVSFCTGDRITNSVSAAGSRPRNPRYRGTGRKRNPSPADRNAAWAVYNGNGARKYLTRSETRAFLDAARRREPAVRGFCWIIAATGCRISEALSLTPESIDFEAGQVVIESLKKRGKRVFRAIPLPARLLDCLRQWLDAGLLGRERLWPWSRMTGYRRICEVMETAGVVGPHASPKGLRHGFGVRAVQSTVPLNLVQRWLGHADIKTTAIYTSATGPEEREIAARMWSDQEPVEPLGPIDRPDQKQGTSGKLAISRIATGLGSAIRQMFRNIAQDRIISILQSLTSCSIAC